MSTTDKLYYYKSSFDFADLTKGLNKVKDDILIYNDIDLQSLSWVPFPFILQNLFHHEWTLLFTQRELQINQN